MGVVDSEGNPVEFDKRYSYDNTETQTELFGETDKEVIKTQDINLNIVKTADRKDVSVSNAHVGVGFDTLSVSITTIRPFYIKLIETISTIDASVDIATFNLFVDNRQIYDKYLTIVLGGSVEIQDTILSNSLFTEETTITFRIVYHHTGNGNFWCAFRLSGFYR
jgi:hypothetical protein